MSLRWLSSMVGGRVVPGIRRRAAPIARRDLTSEIEADALGVDQIWVRKLLLDPDSDDQPTPAVVALIDPGLRSEVSAWLNPRQPDALAQRTIRTDWLLFPATPEAVLMAVVEAADGGDGSFRFNLRLNADRYRRQLQIVARCGQLGLTTKPLQVGPDRELLSPCRFVPIQTGPLRDFL